MYNLELNLFEEIHRAKSSRYMCNSCNMDAAYMPHEFLYSVSYILSVKHSVFSSLSLDVNIFLHPIWLYSKFITLYLFYVDHHIVIFKMK